MSDSDVQSYGLTKKRLPTFNLGKSDDKGNREEANLVLKSLVITNSRRIRELFFSRTAGTV